MISMIEGEGVGAGKTYYAVKTFIAPHVASGGVVYTNDKLELLWPGFTKYVEDEFGVTPERDQWRTYEDKDTWRLHEETPPGTDDLPVLIVIDESQGALNTRDTRDDKKRPLFDWVCQSRHDNTDLCFITQNKENVDVQIRRLMTHVYQAINMTQIKIPGLGQWPFKQFLIRRFGSGGKRLQEWNLERMDKRIFGAYRSKACQGMHKRSGEEVKKRTLKKTNKSTRKMRLLFWLLMLGAGYGVFKMYKMFQDPGAYFNGGKPKSEQQATPVPAQPVRANLATGETTPVQATAPLYRIGQEEFKGTDGKTYLRTDAWTYRVGELSPSGLVQAVRDRCVAIADLNGGTLYVVARDVQIGKAAVMPPTQTADKMLVNGLKGGASVLVGSGGQARALAGLAPTDAEQDANRRRAAGLPPEQR